MPARLDDYRCQKYHSEQVNSSWLNTPHWWFSPKNHGDGGSSFVQYRPLILMNSLYHLCSGFCAIKRPLSPLRGLKVESNTAHKNRLTIPSSGFLHLFALSKGENETSLGSKKTQLVRYQIVIVRVPDTPAMKPKLNSNPGYGLGF